MKIHNPAQAAENIQDAIRDLEEAKRRIQQGDGPIAIECIDDAVRQAEHARDEHIIGPRPETNA